MLRFPRSPLLCTLLLLCTLSAQAQEADVRVYRPAKVGLGSLLVRGVNHFQQPLVYEVALNPQAVHEALPQPLEPRLKRPSETMMDRIGAIFRTRIFMRTLNHVLRRVESPAGISTQQELRDHFGINETHTYAITGDAFAFARTGPQFGKDLVSKHAIIAEDFMDVRYAGQLWREDENTMCFNSNSGTFLKKRKSAGLTPAPEHEAAGKIVAAVFSPALTVKHCREIAPWFGADEAIDQAQKAIAAADEADALAEDVATVAEEARRLSALARAEADRAYDAASAASEAEAAYQREATDETRQRFFELDRKAADAADSVQKYRKKIEKLTDADDN